MIRFIAFVLGASCATTFNPRCVPYAVISSFALVLSLLTVIVEWLHFHLLWNFRPDAGNSLTKRPDRSHLRFIPDKLANDQRHRHWSVSLCKNDKECGSNSLNHTILYHSIGTARVKNDKTTIAYHVTTTELAVGIAQNGFPVNNYRQLNPDIYFTRIVERSNNADAANLEAIICVRLSLGHVLEVDNDNELAFDMHSTPIHLIQTLECRTSGKIKVRFPGQIENWVIVLPTGVNEGFDLSYYEGCI